MSSADIVVTDPNLSCSGAGIAGKKNKQKQKTNQSTIEIETKLTKIHHKIIKNDPGLVRQVSLITETTEISVRAIHMRMAVDSAVF